MDKSQELEWLEAQKIIISVDLIAAAKQQLQFLAAVDRNRCLYDSPVLSRAIHRHGLLVDPHDYNQIVDALLRLVADYNQIADALQKPEATQEANSGKKYGDNTVNKYPNLRRRWRFFVIAVDYYSSDGLPNKKMLQTVGSQSNSCIAVLKF